MRVLLLGGVGAMCTPTTRDIVERGEFSEVKIADINVDKAKKLAEEIDLREEAVVKVDASDKGSLTSLVNGFDVVVNGLPKKFAEDVLAIAIQVKANCCDLGSPSDDMLALDAKAKEAGMAYAGGCGATPGVTNMMAIHGADRMDQVNEINISFAAVRAFALSPALI